MFFLRSSSLYIIVIPVSYTHLYYVNPSLQIRFTYWASFCTLLSHEDLVYETKHLGLSIHTRTHSCSVDILEYNSFQYFVTTTELLLHTLSIILLPYFKIQLIIIIAAVQCFTHFPEPKITEEVIEISFTFIESIRRCV